MPPNKLLNTVKWLYANHFDRTPAWCYVHQHFPDVTRDEFNSLWSSIRELT